MIPGWLAAPVVPMAWCWRIERADGVTLGLTTHDRDLMIGGLLHRAAPGMAIIGYAASGGSVREAVSPLAALLPVARAPGGDWRLAESVPAIPLPAAASIDGAARTERVLGAADRLPQAISHSHFDPARDFQISIQTASLPGGRAAATALDLPLAQTASAARALIEREAAQVRAARTRTSWPGGLAALAVPPGAAIFADGMAMRVVARRIEGGAPLLELAPLPSITHSAFAADSGRAVTAPDDPAGDTIAALFDLPAISGSDGDAPKLVLAATGTGRGWRRATVMITPAADALPVDGGVVRAASVLGRVTGWQGAGTVLLVDRRSSVDVELVRADMTLHNASTADLIAGANAAMIGDEVIHFGVATPLGPRQWRLSELLRGRQGTEDAVAVMAVDAPFVLLGDAGLLPLEAAGLSVGGAILVEAVGGGAAVNLPIVTAGRAMRPLPPVHLHAQWQDDGGLALHWIRRSRTGFGWADGVDAPQDALPENYRLVLAAGGTEVAIQTASPGHSIPAAQITSWRSASVGALAISVQQIGPHALSLPATLSISL